MCIRDRNLKAALMAYEELVWMEKRERLAIKEMFSDERNLKAALMAYEELV